MKNMIVGQSGGPTAVINGSLYGVVSEGFKHPESIEHVYGMINGVEGFLSNQIMDMHPLLKTEIRTGTNYSGSTWVLPLQAAGRFKCSSIS
ncbi:MAG: hypothetical protein ACLTCI_12210 [[Clostridium] nexile]